MFKTHFAMFMAGITVGAAAAWLYAKKHYEKIAQEEIDSVKAAYGKGVSLLDNSSMHPSSIVAEELFSPEYTKRFTDAAKTEKEGKKNYAKPDKKEKQMRKDISDTPYVISPDAFGEFDDYVLISLTYYSDGVLTDEDDEPIDDIEGIVGKDYASHFGEYEEDSVFIRNDRMKCDYEILRDLRKYTDVLVNKH